MSHHEDGAAHAVSAAGGEEGQQHGEDHDGQAQGEAPDPALPRVREHVVVLALDLLHQLVQAGNTLALEDLNQKMESRVTSNVFLMDLPDFLQASHSRGKFQQRPYRQ